MREPSGDPAPGLRVFQAGAPDKVEQRQVIRAVVLCLNSRPTASVSITHDGSLAPRLGALCVAVIASGAARKWGVGVRNLEFQALFTHVSPTLPFPLLLSGETPVLSAGSSLLSPSLPRPLANLKRSPFCLENKTQNPKTTVDRMCKSPSVMAVVLLTERATSPLTTP